MNRFLKRKGRGGREGLNSFSLWERVGGEGFEGDSYFDLKLSWPNTAFIRNAFAATLCALIPNPSPRGRMELLCVPLRLVRLQNQLDNPFAYAGRIAKPQA